MTGSRETSNLLEPFTRDGESSLVDLIDSLLNQGLMVDGDLVLGLAGVDLVYLRLSTLLAAADRVLPHARRPSTPGVGKRQASGSPSPEPSRSSTTLPPPLASEAARTSAAPRDHVHDLEQEELEAVSEDLAHRADTDRPGHFDPDPEEVRRSVLKLVLTLVELIRDVLERQALRRMDAETLTEDEVERLGRALMELEETVHELAAQFDIDPDELQLDLGPLGTLR